MIPDPTRCAHRPAPPSGVDTEAGSGVLGLFLGVLFFVGFLLLAVQITVSLHVRTAAAGAALDAGRIMARAGGMDGQTDDSELRAAQRAATERVHDLLGTAADLEIERVDQSAGRVVVIVRVPRPRFVLGGGTLGSTVLQHRADLRIEQLR